MGVVKYTGPVASFHCPTNAEIRSLKVHFSPKQEGTGDPSPENVREIVGWDGVVVHNDDGIIVPEEYQKVEYLESDGHQYIDTQIIPTNNLIIDSTIELASDRSIANEGILGSRQSSGGGRVYLISFYGNTWHYGIDGDSMINSSYPIVRYTPIKVHVEYLNRQTLLEVGGKILYTGSPAYQGNEYSMYLFACNNYGSVARQCASRVYYLKIQKDNVIAREYIPCRRKSDNKPGMYDTVTQTFFTNQGTGEFICGPDVGETVDYEFGVLGKNKLDPNLCQLQSYWNSNQGRGYVSDWISIDYISVSPNTTYTITGSLVTSENTTAKHLFYNKNKELISSIPAGTSNQTFTTPNECQYVRLSIKNTSLDNLQLELGSTATSYEPYDPKHTVYGGWVDLISGEVQQEWTEPLTLGEPYYYGNNVCFEYTYPSKYSDYSSSSPVDRVFSTFMKSDFSINPRNHFVFGGNSTFVKTDGNGHLNPEWTEWYDSLETKPTISLKLFEPITYHLAPTELQTFLGQNNIWSNADYVEVEYDLHETQEILNRKAFIMANQPHLVAPEAAQLQSFTTDVPAPLKECKAYFKPKQDFNGYDRPWPAGGGKNLFNENNMTYGVWTSSTGTVDNLASYGCMANDKIFIAAGTALYLTIFGNELYSKAMVFYNTDGTFNSRVYSTGTTQLTYTPAIDCYVAIELAQGTSTSTSITEEYVKAAKVVLSAGSAATVYEPYENICPIEGWNELEVWRTGKNLAIKPSKFYRGYGGKAYNDADENLVETDTGFKCTPKNGSSGYSTLIAYVYKGQTYTLSFTKTGYCARWLYSITNKSDIGTKTGENSTNFLLFNSEWIYNWNTPIQITPTVDGYLYLNCHQNSNTPTEYECNNIQLELGGTATDYETYNGTTIPITFPTEAGTIYGGYVDLVRGEIVATSQIITVDGSQTLNGPYAYYNGLTCTNRYITITNLQGGYSRSYDTDASSHFSRAFTAIWTHPDDDSWKYTYNGQQLHMVFENSIVGITEEISSRERTEKIKNWLIENQPQFIYPLSTPIYYSITPEILKTLRGTNNIWSSANDNIEIKYFKH